MLSQAITGIRCLLLVFSFYGYVQLARKKMDAEIALAFVMSAIGSVMFAAGILNVLVEAACVICAGGAALGVWSIVRRDRVLDVATVGTLAFAAFCIYFAVILPGTKFAHYDNFSHWATAPKIIIANNRFPNFADKTITFQSYPLGSAAFIYYFVKIIGVTEEWVQMYAQAVLMAGMFTTIFSFVRKWPGYLLAAATAVVLMAGNTDIADLLVDTLLPAVGIAGLAACIRAKDDLADKLWITLPFTLFLMSIKNSGVFFILIILVYALMHAWRSIPKKKGMWLVTAASPFLLLFLWQKHVKLVFANGMNAKHSMSLSNFASVLGDKTMEDVGRITEKMSSTLFTWSNTIVFLLAFLLVLAVVVKLVLREKDDEGRGLGLFTVVCTAAYLIGIYGMYMFTMPTSEAVALAGYSRYYKTILVFASGMAAIRMILLLNSAMRDTWRGVVSFLAAAVCGAAVWFTVAPDLDFYRRHTTPKRRATFDRLIEKYKIPSGGKYIVVHTSNDSGYLYYLTRYLLTPEKVTSVTEDWFAEHPDEWRNYDYIIPIQKTEITENYLRENFEDKEVINLKKFKKK